MIWVSRQFRHQWWHFQIWHRFLRRLRPILVSSCHDKCAAYTKAEIRVSSRFEFQAGHSTTLAKKCTPTPWLTDSWFWEKVVLTKLRLTWPYIFTLRQYHVMWKVSIYVLHVCVSEGICVKYIYLGSFLNSRFSEICVKRIRINQGVGAYLIKVQSWTLGHCKSPISNLTK